MTAPADRPAKVPLQFPCAAPGCKAWGTHGYGVFLLKGIDGTWYCRDHKPADAADVEPEKLPPANGTQGVLF